MSDNTNFNELKSLLEWVNQSGDIEELSIKYGDIELALSKTPDGLSHLKAAPAAAPAPAPAAPEAPKAEAPAPEPAPAPAAAPAPAEAPKEEAPKPEAAPASSSNGVEVKSPMVGTFYAAPKPGADPFVKVGDTVEVGQVLCIVEAMKLMNEIEADVAGEVVKRIAASGQPVEYGQPLFAIKAR